MRVLIHDGPADESKENDITDNCHDFHNNPPE
jgi:hypothetical protein